MIEAAVICYWNYKRYNPGVVISRPQVRL